MTPQRFQLSRNNGWRKPQGAVVVTRGTVWGNPFKIGEPSGHQFSDGGDATPMIAAMTRDQVLSMYHDLLRGFITPEMHPQGHAWMREFKRKMRGGHPTEMAVSYLRGKDLCCWCRLDQPCHADVLLELANETRGSLPETGWMIWKDTRGWYRPDAAGYTYDPSQAGRYSYADALAHSHPNGINGPRDGMSIKHESHTGGRND